MQQRKSLVVVLVLVAVTLGNLAPGVSALPLQQTSSTRADIVEVNSSSASFDELTPVSDTTAVDRGVTHQTTTEHTHSNIHDVTGGTPVTNESGAGGYWTDILHASRNPDTWTVIGKYIDLDEPVTLQAEAQDWYDTAWAYRRPIDITNPCGEETTDYQVQIVLDSSFDFSKAVSDGGDLRVTSSDGVTIIPYWIEDWDAGNQLALIWIRVPSVPLEGTTIYLYYGNEAATSASDGQATFEFFDDDWDLPTQWGNPIHTIEGEGSWAQDYVSYPNVFKEGDTYYMLYDGHHPHQKGLATSSDLVSWTSLQDPVVTRSVN